MSLTKAIKAQLGLSVTPANNFTLDASADNGTMKLARNSGQDIMTVAADGKVAFPQNNSTAPGTVAASCVVSVSGGVPTKNSSHNVGVVGRPSVGQFNVTLDPPLPDTKAAVVVAPGNLATGIIATVSSVTTSNVGLSFYTLAGALADPSGFSIIVTRQP